MTITKIISGGQTGADQAALFTARMLHIPTGGTAPKGWRTETGPEPSLAGYGLVESDSPAYSLRTMQNVRDSDGSAVFGRIESYGSAVTIQLCEKFDKPHIVNPTGPELAEWCEANHISVLNVAGNRASRTPGIFDQVEGVLVAAFGAIEL